MARRLRLLDASDNPLFTKTYQLLEQEGFVIRSCLCAGLTDLRKANLADKGGCYTAFFQLAIGIERMAKLALILDHMAQNNLEAPGENAMRRYGHDLKVLYENVRQFAHARGYEPRDRFVLPQLSNNVLTFLSEFAKGMRYANLDMLASGSPQTSPLHEWNCILKDTIASDVSVKEKERITKQSKAIAEALRSNTLVFSTNLADSPLTVDTIFAEPALQDVANKHLVWKVLCLLVPLRDFIVESSNRASQTESMEDPSVSNIPDMREFFHFISIDRAHALRKKIWP